MSQRDEKADDASPAGPQAGPGTADCPARADPGSPNAVWERFEALMAAAPAQSPEPAETVAAPRVRPAPRAPAEPRPSPLRPATAQPSPPLAATKPGAIGPAGLGGRAVWRHRAEGAVAMALVVLLAFSAGWISRALRQPPPAEASQFALREAEAEAGFAEDSMLALAETARVAAIAAANPPYRVVLHVEQGVAARDLARLDTAIRAWGFAAPQRVAATETTPLPEVRFFDEADREAALTLGGIAERLLGEAALTPPQRPAEPLAGLAAADSAEAAAQGPSSQIERLLELHVPARPVPQPPVN